MIELKQCINQVETLKKLFHDNNEWLLHYEHQFVNLLGSI